MTKQLNAKQVEEVKAITAAAFAEITKERDAAVARAEVAEAERDRLVAQWEAWQDCEQCDRYRAAEARIARVAAQLEAGPPSAFSGVKVQGYNWCSDAVRAALAEPVEPISLVGFAVGEPQPSACATCGGEKWVDDPTWALADELPPYVPCPSCTPSDPESETRRVLGPHPEAFRDADPKETQ